MPSEPEIPQDVSISEELLMNIQRLRRSSSPELPDTVTKLETPEGCKVYLVGTAHFSKESQDDVAKVGPFHLYFYYNNNLPEVMKRKVLMMTTTMMTIFGL